MPINRLFHTTSNAGQFQDVVDNSLNVLQNCIVTGVAYNCQTVRQPVRMKVVAILVEDIINF